VRPTALAIRETTEFCASRPQEKWHDLSPESQRIAISGRDLSDQSRNVFVSEQKYFFLGTRIWTWVIRYLIRSLGAKEMDSTKAEKCAHPALFVRDNVGQVLQRRVSSNGKDAGDRLCVPTRRMQRQDALAITSLNRLKVIDDELSVGGDLLVAPFFSGLRTSPVHDYRSRLKNHRQSS
jgi:hypothetical protein